MTLEEYDKMHTQIVTDINLMMMTIFEPNDSLTEEENKKLVSANTHLVHAIGELIEAKSNLFPLSSMEKWYKLMYEEEMNNLLNTTIKTQEFSDILEN